MLVPNNGVADAGEVTLTIDVTSTIGPVLDELISIYRDGVIIASNLTATDGVIFYTETLPAGVYYYTVSCDGGPQSDPYIITLVEGKPKGPITGTKILSVDTVYISFDPLPVGPPSPEAVPEPLCTVHTIGLTNLGTGSLTINAADGLITRYVSFDMYPIYLINGIYYGPNGSYYWTGDLVNALMPAIVIAPGETFYFDVYWYATASYQYSNSIVYRSDADNGDQITYVDINWSRDVKTLVVTPINLKYSFDNLTTSDSQELKIRNAGNSTVTVFDIYSWNDSDSITWLPDYSGLGGSERDFTMEPYSSKSFTMAYSAIRSGKYTDTVAVWSDSNWNGDTDAAYVNIEVYGPKIYAGELERTFDNPNVYGTAANDKFGQSVAISVNNIIVGAVNEDSANGVNSGKAYIFDATTGNLLHTINNPNSALNNFGVSVGISGNFAIVGAASDGVSANEGKAFIFDATTGALIHTLNNPNAYSTTNDDQFGYSVAISGNYAIVGAYGEDSADADDSGKAYIFDVTTGNLLYTLNNPNAYGAPPVYDYFGYAVAISVNYAIVSAPRNSWRTIGESDAGGENSGKVYVFDVTTGELLKTLNSPNNEGDAIYHKFGETVAVYGNYAVVGSPKASNNPNAYGGSGRVHIFDITSFRSKTIKRPTQTFDPSNDTFGTSVAILNNNVSVGAPGVGGLAGEVYVFDATTKDLLQSFSNPNVNNQGTSDNFGNAIAISNNRVVVGDRQVADTDGENSGKTYTFTLADIY